jgi:hypothetical protein
LKTDTVHVQFKKVKDGEIRNMRCTLVEDLIPESQKPKTVAYADDMGYNQDIIKVFDLDVDGWRSFRVDSVIEYRGSKQHRG